MEESFEEVFFVGKLLKKFPRTPSKLSPRFYMPPQAKAFHIPSHSHALRFGESRNAVQTPARFHFRVLTEQ